MDSSAAIRTGEHSSDVRIVKNEPSKGKTIGFAIVIILGLGGLAVAGVGLDGYLQVGSLSGLGQVNSIIMMAAGGGGGIVFLIIGIVGCVKNRPVERSSDRSKRPLSKKESERPEEQGKSKESGSTGKSASATKTGTTDRLDAQGRRNCYGPEAWPELGKKWGYTLEIADENIPPEPKDKVAEGRIRIYLPKKVIVNGKEKPVSLNTLKEISGKSFRFLNDWVREECGDNIAHGWIDIDRQVDPESLGKDYATLKKSVEAKGCQLPAPVQATALNLMVFALTEERLYGNSPLVYTYCDAVVKGKYPVVVGGFGSVGLAVDHYYFDYVHCGAACALR